MGANSRAEPLPDTDAPAPAVPSRELDLLNSSHGGHRWFDFCEGQADTVALPADPRSLVQPGISDGRAVLFNVKWQDCHADPELVGEKPHPKTCGELRQQWEAGDRLMRGNGRVGSGNFFSGTEPGGYLTLSAEEYNRLWTVWGLPARPDNFEELMAQRYGLAVSPERNPYPLPGEDPNSTDGGSGQLPINLTQTRNADGSWSGRIGFTCHGCHSSAVGLAEEGEGLGARYGLGTGLTDIGLFSRDFGLVSQRPTALFGLFGASRGTNNAQFGNLVAIPDFEPGPEFIELLVGWLTSGTTASMDTPNWWNMGHRPNKFIDGLLSSDAVRVDMAFYTPTLDNYPSPTGQDSGAWVRSHNQDADIWVLGLKAPEYPLDIDENLARQGAILFHVLDLWGREGNPAPRPEGGNGSCASCHGAYANHFANDPAFLATPELKGVGGYITPLDVIRTDPVRLEAYGRAYQETNGGASSGYPETVGRDNDCGSQTREDLRGDREEGYLAPPLFGVWASAPYFHNGSVPDVWGVLDPSARPKLWKRQSTPARPDQEGQVVMGYDVSIERAYNPDRLGWNYEEMACGDGTIPVLNCDPMGGEDDALGQQLLAQAYGNVVAAWNVGNAPILLDLTPEQVENRKIYNTNLFSQGNEGHDFTAVLSDAERRALIEYMKTL